MWVLKVCGKEDLVGEGQAFGEKEGIPKISFCRDDSPGNQD